MQFHPTIEAEHRNPLQSYTAGVDYSCFFEEERPEQAQLRILVMESNVRRLEKVYEHLSRRGHIVYRALMVEQGLQMAKVIQPDLILINPSLTGRRSRKVASLLRSDEATESIPLVAMLSNSAPKGINGPPNHQWDACIHNACQSDTLADDVLQAYRTKKSHSVGL
ncbi:MAG: hypothetical protein EP343_33745 [Deltaproteobacteria bacterium]|nr:MAG: hypothetical protein EP343_33745 [Deltaproteobacteria bacterium]